MSDDLLEQATRALRETAAEGDSEARFTRARVMSSLHQRRVKRRARLAFVLPVAACFVAATAWGAATGKIAALVSSVQNAFEDAPESSEQAAPKPSAPPRKAVPTVQTSEPVVPAERTPDTSESEQPIAEPAEPKHRASEAPEAKAPTSAKPSASAAALDKTIAPDDPTHELYRKAHRAHFEAKDPRAALEYWNEYLRQAPGGKFALEASYNRALCLVRLGRMSEARTALEPFANGTYGAYRQKEARQLLERMNSSL